MCLGNICEWVILKTNKQNIDVILVIIYIIFWNLYIYILNIVILWILVWG